MIIIFSHKNTSPTTPHSEEPRYQNPKCSRRQRKKRCRRVTLHPKKWGKSRRGAKYGVCLRCTICTGILRYTASAYYNNDYTSSPPRFGPQRRRRPSAIAFSRSYSLLLLLLLPPLLSGCSSEEGGTGRRGEKKEKKEKGLGTVSGDFETFRTLWEEMYRKYDDFFPP